MEINVKPLNTAIEAAKQFVEKVITPPLEQVGGIFADQVKLWRLKNQINIVSSAEKLLKDKGIKTKKVSLKIMASLLEECSLEEDEELQKMWAALLANTVSENSAVKTHIFISTLKEMTTEDAEIFQAIVEHCTESTIIENQVEIKHLNRAISPDAFKEYPNIDLTFDNLKRLRLIREITTHGESRVPVVATEIGLQFIIACS